MGNTTVERLTKLENQVSTILDTQTAIKKDIEGMKAKLDELIAIKQKGVGAFWLASILFGTTIVGFFTKFVDWFKT